jgi:FkbM family methyltransferase
VRLPWGLDLRVDPRESIGSAVWRLGLYDLVVSETLWRLTSPGDLTVDVGANLGHMTGLLALRAGPTGRVLAFEPHPGVFADLTANLALAAADPRTAPIEAFQTALSDAEGTGQLATGDHFAVNRSIARLVDDKEVGISVQTTTLDSALAGRTAAVVKIDVEGSTHRVLAGTSDSLREGRIRDLIYEAHEDERDLLAGILRGHGYTLYALGQTTFRLALGDADKPPLLPGYEAPSYLATREPARALSALQPPGWRVLSSARR